MARRRDPKTLSLLEWQPTTPVDRFEPTDVRAATLAAQISKAMKLSLEECELTRPQVARAMSDFLGREVPLNSLNTYVSEARADHIINVVRFTALIAATRDRRLLELIAEQFGWVVIDAKYLDVIEEHELAEKREEIDARLQQLKRAQRRGAR